MSGYQAWLDLHSTPPNRSLGADLTVRINSKPSTEEKPGEMLGAI